MTRILITGAGGFIGSHLAEELLKEGMEVIGMDNLSSGSQENIDILSSMPGFRFIEHDVTLPTELDGELDLIYHLASRASPIDYQKFPVETALSNSIGTKNMLDLAALKDATLLFTSTSEAYGQPLVHPQSEEYWGNVSPTGVRSCYDESKRFGEALMMAYHRQYGIRTRIARIFNTYGPRMRTADGRVIPNFITQALSDEEITIYGDGSQTRSFCFISDMVQGLRLLIGSVHTEPQNLGNPHEVTILEVASLIIEIIGSSSKFVFKPLPIDDPTKRRPDISKARKLLNWSPKVDLREGLELTIEYYRKKIK